MLGFDDQCRALGEIVARLAQMARQILDRGLREGTIVVERVRQAFGP